MYVRQFCAIICILCAAHFNGRVSAYPAINNRNLFGFALKDLIKRSHLELPQIDSDVVELENLRVDNKPEPDTKAVDDDVVIPIVDVEQQQNKQKLLNDFETHMDGGAEIKEALSTPIAIETVITTVAAIAEPTELVKTSTLAPSHDAGHESKQPEHHHPMAPHKTPTEKQAYVAGSEAMTPAPVSITKPFYGAARLAFGQNPEIFPISSTTGAPTTTTTTTATSTTVNGGMPPVMHRAEEFIANDNEQILESVTRATTKHHADMEKVSNAGDEIINPSNIDVEIDKLETKSAARRSVSLKVPNTKFADTGAPYSSFNVAQYVYWTGDEAGVANAIEELIKQKLITRESALSFLRNIRRDIEFLQKFYAVHFPNENKKPEQYIQQEAHIIDNLARFSKRPAMLNKLPEASVNELKDYEEETGKLRYADYLYDRNELDEILNKLAKARRTEEAQRELRNLAAFVDREENFEAIPIDLQKKILRVLLVALTHALNEHPELLGTAYANALSPYNQNLIQTYGLLK